MATIGELKQFIRKVRCRLKNTSGALSMRIAKLGPVESASAQSLDSSFEEFHELLIILRCMCVHIAVNDLAEAII
jgi:hypothetical protein